MLIKIAKWKSEIDKDSSWYQGSSIYLVEIKKEVDEVVEEIPKDRLCYLEDELGDDIEEISENSQSWTRWK